jgi:N-acyl-D-amino-acid deacylase
MLRVLAAFGVAVLVASGHLVVRSAQPEFDLLIVNGRVLDGSGNPWSRQDIGVRGDRIAAIGRLDPNSAARVVDAAGRIIAPGFIDVHSHALTGIGRESLRDAQGLIAQGITTIVGNPDGGGPVDLRQQAGELEDGGIGVNAALLIGHGSVRRAVLGDVQRQPTAEELEEMLAIVRQAVADGAFGLSSGLFYTPGRWAETEEVIALAREAGHVYTSHVRDEASYDVGVVASVDEVIRIAEEAGVRGVVSHMKALGPDSWGLSETLVANIDAARARGVEVYADQYPYEASSTSIGAALMPGEGGQSAREAMATDASREIFLDRIRENIRRRGGPESLVIASGRGASDFVGRHLGDIAEGRGVSPEQAAVDIVLAGGASIISFNMSHDDIDRIMRRPWTMASSDGGLNQPGQGQPHPRSNGSFARRIARYVGERQVLSLEHAIRTATSLPARVFELPDRGAIRVGAFADLLVFDPEQVIDHATWDDPHRFSEGFDWVIINGRVAQSEGEFQAVRAGRVLRPADR